MNPLTGQILWNHETPCDAIASTAVQGEMIYAPLSATKSGLAAWRVPPGNGALEVLWESSRLRASTSSPVCYQDKIFAISGSILKCAKAQTGDLLWQLRLTGSFSSTPVAAGGKLYCFNEDGLCQVVQIDDKEGKIIGTGELGETILCSPAIAHDALFARSDGHLWKIAVTQDRQ